MMQKHYNMIFTVFVCLVTSVTFHGCTESENKTSTESINSYFHISSTHTENATFRPQGEWGYQWPHDISPLQIDGMQYISGPIDNSVKNGGRNAINWNQPLVFKHPVNNTQIKIWPAKDFDRTPMTSVGHELWAEWEKILFKEIPAGRLGFTYPTALGSKFNEAKSLHTVYLMIRDNGDLFRIQAMGEDPELVNHSAIEVGKAIIIWRIDNVE